MVGNRVGQMPLYIDEWLLTGSGLFPGWACIASYEALGFKELLAPGSS
jgi:hypothetical protein